MVEGPGFVVFLDLECDKTFSVAESEEMNVSKGN